MSLPFCIYCDETDAKNFAGREHVIPQAFGKFGSRTPTLKCVCDGCNAAFSKDLDQMLARDTYEGILRYKQGIFSSEKRPQRRLRFTLAEPTEAGELLGAVVEGVDPTNDMLMPLATQLQVVNRQTGKTDIFTRSQLGTLALPEEVYGIPGERQLCVFAPTKMEHDCFIDDLNRAGFDVRMDGASIHNLMPSQAGECQTTLGVYIEGVFDDLHRRALAKILINFAAFYLDKAEVQKPQWEAVKRFVRHGEGKLGARLSDRPFWGGQETDNMRWPDAINIRLENQQRGVVGIIQFYNRITYELLLIEGYHVSQEMAARFTAGTEPEFGYRGVRMGPGIMQPQRLGKALVSDGQIP